MIRETKNFLNLLGLAKALPLNNGVLTQKYDDGTLKLQGHVKDGKKTGTWVFYFSNGKKQSSGNYVDGKKHGLWTFFYEDGKTKQKEYFHENLRSGH